MNSAYAEFIVKRRYVCSAWACVVATVSLPESLHQTRSSNPSADNIMQ